jgi:diacylglycerol kinase (ATP)
MVTFENALLIINPRSGIGRGVRTSARVERGLREHGIACSARVTGGPGDATKWARSAAEEGFDLIVAIGGDGTLQEIVAGQARSERKVPVSLIPTGTANVVAIALSLPWLPGPAVETIVAGRVRRFDVGYLPELDRHFILMAAVGYPARIIEGSSRRMKNVFGVFAYIWVALRNLVKPGHTRITVVADDEAHNYVAHTVFVANIGSIGDINLRISPDTSPHDGRFDLTIISSRTVWDLLLVIVRMLTWRRPVTRRLRYLQARNLRIEANPPLPIQIDGESLGETPFAAEVKPQAVDLVVGARYSRRSANGR